MKNSYLYRLLPCFLLLIFGLHIEAVSQVTRSGKNKEKSDWVKDLWFGGGINLGFSSDSYNSIFGFGISPMAGYKINSFFSVGPRVSLDYTTAKYSIGNGVYKYNSFDYGLGVFARFKFLETFFVHLEYSQLNETYATGYIVNNELEKYRQWRDIALLGLGYNSNQIWSYEIYINYNFLEETSSIRVPIIYRAGITYNF